MQEVLIRPEVDAVDAHAHSIRGPPPSLPVGAQHKSFLWCLGDGLGFSVQPGSLGDVASLVQLCTHSIPGAILYP